MIIGGKQGGFPLEKNCICTRNTIYDLHSILYKD